MNFEDTIQTLQRTYAPPAGMMTRNAVQIRVDELRQRLEREGKSPAEIDEAIYAYVGPKGSTKR